MKKRQDETNKPNEIILIRWVAAEATKHDATLITATTKICNQPDSENFRVRFSDGMDMRRPTKFPSAKSLRLFPFVKLSHRVSLDKMRFQPSFNGGRITMRT